MLLSSQLNFSDKISWKKKYFNRKNEKTVSPFDVYPYFVCLRTQNKDETFSICLSVCSYRSSYRIQTKFRWCLLLVGSFYM